MNVSASAASRAFPAIADRYCRLVAIALKVAYLEEIERHRIAIDSGFGGAPFWQELDRKKACRIRLSSPASLADETAWPEHQAWLVDHLLSHRAAIDGVGGLPQLLRKVSVSD